MNWFNEHPVLFALVAAGVAIAYGIGLAVWLLRRPAGTERMQEIARAVQEGAAAYLRKQSTTIAAVAVVPFVLLGVYDKLLTDAQRRAPEVLAMKRRILGI